MDDLLQEFLTETTENLGLLDVDLVHLEQQSADPTLIATIFRIVHTIKGTCGFLGLPRLEAVAHAAENVLGQFRDGALQPTTEAINPVLAAIDRIKEILAVIEASEAEPAGDDNDLIGALNAVAEGRAGGDPAAAPDVAAEPVAESLDAAETPAEAEDEPEPEPAVAAAPAHDALPPAKPAAAPPAAAAAAAKPANDEHAAQAPAESAVANQSIRVNVGVLENLMTMVSELVLTRNQLLQMVRGLEESEFALPVQRLSHITSELQEGVMKTRMQPIGNAWNKFPRILRDLSHELGKKYELEMVGADTELDRQILDQIKDPLLHMVRNSADHGIDTPAERRARGKPEAGRIRLHAYHEGGHIIVKISDDGRGIDAQRIKAKALERGLATEAELEGMSEAKLMQFLFRPGFSTAEKVTAVSGRGVGLDVVRSNIEKIGGTIELKSVLGKGTTFTFKIPLTLAIVSALIVECAGESFAIPQIGVVELVRVAENAENRVERIHDAPVLRLRNRLLPLVFLDECLNLRPAGSALRASEMFVIVTQVGAARFGIVVDRVFDTEEIVIKPVAPILRNLEIFAGNTILGDGRVIMILDAAGIAVRAGMAAAVEAIGEYDDAAGDAHVLDGEDITALLVFRAGSDAIRAVPLSLVARLEEIDVANIERADGRALMQYRGGLIPIVTIDDTCAIRSEGRQPMLVFADGENSLGIAVDEIVDIVEDRLDITQPGQKPGVLGSAVVAGKATEILDVGHYLEKRMLGWGGSSSRNRAQAKRILLVDQNPFFRNMLTPLLSVAGYRVTAAESVDEALRLREEGREFDVIVSDMDTPSADGASFANAIKEGELWHDTPLVALAASANAVPGEDAGFTGCVAKFDRAALLDTLSQTLAARGAA